MCVGVVEFGGILPDTDYYSGRISHRIWASPVSPALKSRPVEDVELVEYVKEKLLCWWNGFDCNDRVSW